MNYIAPLNFLEFIERYPSLIENRIKSRWRNIRGVDPEDLVQEVSLHLMDLPEDSIYRQRGCTDRIGTFDPSLLPECSERLFLDYVLHIIDNYLISRSGRNRNKMISDSVSISDLRINNDLELGEEEMLGRIENQGFNPYDSDAGLHFEEILNAAYMIHPMIAYAGVALVSFDTKAQAAAFLRITEGRLNYLLAGLKAVIEEDVKTLSKFHVRKAYRSRKVGV